MSPNRHLFTQVRTSTVFSQTLLRAIRDKALRPHRTLYTMAASVLGTLAAGQVYAVLGAESLASPGKALAVITTLVVFTATSLGWSSPAHIWPDGPHTCGCCYPARPPSPTKALPSPSASRPD